MAIGLSMDAFAVSVAAGLATKHNKIKNALKVGLFFGFFQFLMPVIGFFASTRFSDILKDFDHFIAFGLLVYIGIKMIKESMHTPGQLKSDYLILKNLIVLSIATSIDALAAGISIAFDRQDIFSVAPLIGVTTFFLSALGLILAKNMGQKVEKYSEILGGIILICIGVKILVEHLFFTA